MNSALPTKVLFMGLTIAYLQGYGQNALASLERLVSAAQTWARLPGGLKGPALVATVAAGVGVLLLLVFVTLLLIRARRETQKCQKELATLLALRKAAESANNASAEFLASMIPRIRTPMNAIVGFIDLALKADLNPELREHLDTVRTSADWLMHIANDALEFSCIEDGGLPLDNVPFSISECILSAMKIVEREASARKLVTGCKFDPQLPEVVCGDPIRLRQVIFNLLNYVVGFTASGSIILSAALESNSADSVLVRVAITDTGVGIPPAKRALIFESLGHADVGAALKADPTGFGLVISRRLVDLMGGTMEAQSQLGGGSTFEFTVRVQKQKTAVELDALVDAPESVQPKSLSILVADDNAVNLRLITKVLKSAGHQVWTATNGKEAAQSVQTEGFDLILMDMEMPDMDGLEATRAIRTGEAPNLRVPIYALTAHALPGDRDRCLAAGMDGFVTKPIAVDEVLQLVSKIARQPSGACSTQARNQQAPVRLLPGDCLGAAGAADTNSAPIAGTNDCAVSTEYLIPEVNGTTGATSASLRFPDLRDIAIEPANNALTPKYVKQEITTASDTADGGTERGSSRADSGDSSFVYGAIPRDSEDFALNTATASCIPEADATSSADFLQGEEARNLDLSPYLLATAAGTETNSFSGAAGAALNPEIDDTGDIPIDAAEEIASADFADATSPADFLRGEEAWNLDLSPYLLATVAGTETNGFSGATQATFNPEIDDTGDIAIDIAEELASADSDKNVVQEFVQSEELISVFAGREASYGNSDNGEPAANARLSAAAGLALLQATLPQHSPSLAKQADGPTLTAIRDPFEQARKSLSKSSFGIRVIHNDGDPSDRNLI
jgi:signal transduction histidine kinase/CheY-like chemotaxis protein